MGRYICCFLKGMEAGAEQRDTAVVRVSLRVSDEIGDDDVVADGGTAVANGDGDVVEGCHG
jgi:hypothetical protein